MEINDGIYLLNIHFKKNIFMEIKDVNYLLNIHFKKIFLCSVCYTSSTYIPNMITISTCMAEKAQHLENCCFGCNWKLKMNI